MMPIAMILFIIRAGQHADELVIRFDFRLLAETMVYRPVPTQEKCGRYPTGFL